MKKFKSFDEIIDEVYLLWKEQGEWANEAETLMNKCEDNERKMVALLHDAEDMDPDSYQQFLESFNKVSN